jgi:hypothetical protein
MGTNPIPYQGDGNARHARAVGCDIHDEVDVFRCSWRWNRRAERVELHHEAADQNPLIGIRCSDDVEDGAPRRQQIIVTDVYRVCVASHCCLIFSSAAMPAARSRVTVLLARSAAITAFEA